MDDFDPAGGNAAFFIGNAAFWQVRLEEDGQVMVCYKYVPEFDPVYGTARARSTSPGCGRTSAPGDPRARPSGSLLHAGRLSRPGLLMPRSSGGYMVYRPGHWVFEGTHLEYGDVFGGKDRIVGYECDGLDFVTRNGLPYPTGARRRTGEHRDPGARPRVARRAAVPRSARSCGTSGTWRRVVRQLEGKVTPAGSRSTGTARPRWSRSHAGRGPSSTAGRPSGPTGLRGHDMFVERITGTSSTRLGGIRP